MLLILSKSQLIKQLHPVRRSAIGKFMFLGHNTILLEDVWDFTAILVLELILVISSKKILSMI